MRIPLSAPDITEDEIAAVVETLRSPQLSLGPRLPEFEAAFARLTGVPHAVAVSSGTAGLHCAIRALGIGPGDEVIVPSFTFIAAANAVRYEGATPVFADIDPGTLNLAPAAVERALTPRTRALMAVHTFGRPAPMVQLREIAARHNLLIIEDACEAIGAELDGQPVGSFSDAAVFAFYPNKQITTGEGGMVVTPHRSLADRIRSLRNQGRGGGPAPGAADWLQHAELGYNYRLSELACTLGLGQLARLPAILARRAEIAGLYHAELQHLPQLQLPALHVPGARLSWFVYTVRLAPRYTAAHRDQAIRALHAEGIGCARYFAPIHLQPAYAAWRHTSALPATEAAGERTLALPFFNRIHTGEVTEVCEALTRALGDLP